MTMSTAASLASIPLDRLLSDLETSRAGLTEADAVARLKRCGPNDALAHEGQPLAVQFLLRFLNPLVLILLFASALSALAGDTASFLIVVVIVTLSVILDFVQEVHAQNAVDALRRSVAPKALVVRDGRERELHFEELVPGDVVKLAAGDIVPADARLIAARDLFVNQALLTGEPYPAEKHACDLAGEIAQPDEETNLVFMGTSVVSGTATALACRTGKETRIGGLATQLAHRRPPDAFEIGVRRFGFLILRVTFFLVLFVLATNVLFQRPWLESIMFSLALAVGLTPELLPMVVTVTLARGALRLAEPRRHCQAAAGDPRPRRHGHALHRQDRHAHRSEDPAGAPRRCRRSRMPEGAAARLSQQRVRDRHPQPARRRDPRAREAGCRGMDQARRGAVRLRAPARLGTAAGEGDDGAAADRQGCAGGRAQALDASRGRSPAT